MNVKPGLWFVLFLLAAGALLVAAGWVAGQRALTPLESLLLQAIVLLAGLGATLFTGYQSVRRSTAASTRQHARSAFRRVTSLYAGYTRSGALIGRERLRLAGEADADERIPVRDAMLSIDMIEQQLNEQYETLEDALADLRELSPEGVAEIEEQLRERLEP